MRNWTVMGFALLCGTLWAAPSVSEVTARQRYPWNGMVDIDCTLTGTSGTPYSLKVSAWDKVAGKDLAVKTVSVEGESGTGNPVQVTPGTCRLVWNAAADYPNGFRSEKVSISVAVIDQSKKFMIVDLTSGDVSYRDSAPSDGWPADPYLQTQMVLQRVEAGSCWQTLAGGYGRWMTISKPFYVAIAALTKEQLLAVTANTGLNVYNAYNKADEMPLGGNQSIRSFRSFLRNGSWPNVDHTLGDCPISVLRQKTGIQAFDMPTDAQIALAFANNVLPSSAKVACLDWYTEEYCTDSAVCDPMGPSKGTFDSAGSPAYVVRTASGAEYGYRLNYKSLFYLAVYEAE